MHKSIDILYTRFLAGLRENVYRRRRQACTFQYCYARFGWCAHRNLQIFHTVYNTVCQQSQSPAHPTLDTTPQQGACRRRVWALEHAAARRRV